MGSSLCMLALALTTPAPTVAPQAPWSQHHPEAFSALAAWVEKEPGAARLVFWWDRQHPRHAETFLRWIVERPNEALDDFAAAHPDWPAVDEVLKPGRPALESLIVWGRAHGAAVAELASHERGLSRVGFGELAELWQKPQEEPAVR